MAAGASAAHLCSHPGLGQQGSQRLFFGGNKDKPKYKSHQEPQNMEIGALYIKRR